MKKKLMLGALAAMLMLGAQTTMAQDPVVDANQMNAKELKAARKAAELNAVPTVQ